VKGNSVIVSRANTLELVGACAYVSETFNDLYLPDKLWQLIAKPSIDCRWLAVLVSSKEFRARVRAKAAGSSGSMKNIPREAYLSIPVLIPPLSKQRRIADILLTWDGALDSLDRQITRKRKLFTSLREGLVHGTRKLAGHYEPRNTKALGEFLRPIKRAVPKPSEPYLALSLRSHGKGTFHRHVDRPEEVDMDTLYGVGGRDLIVNITFAWEGAIALAKAKDEGCLVSHRFPTFEIDETKVDRDFLGYAVNDKHFFYYLGIASPGGAGRNRVLNQHDFLEIEIPFPTVGEQHLIAKVLVDAERELVALESQRTALERQRDALASELLTGRLRVGEPDRLFEAAG
jgi:type I restriction enzyme S subunit